MIAGRFPGRRPGAVAVFDIDSTIMDTSYRNHAILVEAAEEFPEIAPAIATIRPDEIGWSFFAAIEKRTELLSETRERLEEYWRQRFFRDDYLTHDAPYPGVVDTIAWLIERGYTIAYLTGRDEPNMSRGTLRSFLDHGVPVAADSTLFFFKPDAAEPDLAFKVRAIEEIRAHGAVELVFENEPANANVLARAFPDAAVFLIETITSPNPEPPDRGIVLFSSFPRKRGEPAGPDS